VGADTFVSKQKTTRMQMIPMFLKEMEQEAQVTRKMLSRVPTDKFDWQPHPKSMTMRALATHVAEIPSWVALALNSSELDFATSPYQPAPINNTEELLDLLEQSLAEGKSHLEKAKEADLSEIWTMRNGDDIYMALPKAEVIRHSFSQITHHRAQLGVYLRLLDIPIPGSYGPSADEMN